MVFELTILGANAAIPAHGRFPTSQVLQVNQRFYLIDCGEGAQIQLFRYKIGHAKIHAIFISHLHGDHYLGLMGLLNTMSLHGRKQELFIHAPKGLRDIITLQLQYSNTILSYAIHFVETNPEQEELIYEDEKITVHTIPLLHRVPCCGFLFREKEKDRNLIKEKILPDFPVKGRISLKKGEDFVWNNQIFKSEDYTYPPAKRRSYAFCSDTVYLPQLQNQLREVDLLYHEATFTSAHTERAVQTLHTTAKQAATLAKKAKVGKLLLGHFSTRYYDLTPLLEEARAVFKESHLAIEGQTFEVLV